MSNASLVGIYSLQPWTINSQKEWNFQGGEKKKERWFSKGEKEGPLFKPVVTRL